MRPLKVGFHSGLTLKKSICSALPNAIPQGKCHLDQEAPSRQHRAGNYHFEMCGFKMYWFKAPRNDYISNVYQFQRLKGAG